MVQISWHPRKLPDRPLARLACGVVAMAAATIILPPEIAPVQPQMASRRGLLSVGRCWLGSETASSAKLPRAGRSRRLSERSTPPSSRPTSRRVSGGGCPKPSGERCGKACRATGAISTPRRKLEGRGADLLSPRSAGAATPSSASKTCRTASRITCWASRASPSSGPQKHGRDRPRRRSRKHWRIRWGSG